MSTVTHKEFPRLKPKLEFFSRFFLVFFDCVSYFFSKRFHIGFDFAVLVRHFETASHIQIFQIWEMLCQFKHNFQALKENIWVFDLTSCVHMKTFNIKVCRFHHTFDVTHLVDRNSEFGIDMSSRNFVISTSINMWIDSHKNRIRTTEFISKLLKNRDIIDVDMNFMRHRFLNLSKVNTVWRE